MFIGDFVIISGSVFISRSPYRGTSLCCPARQVELADGHLALTLIKILTNRQ